MGYTAILIGASVIFLKYIGIVSQSRDSASRFFRYYCCFLIVFCTNQLILTISHLLVASACRIQFDKGLFNIGRAAVDVCSSISPIFVLIVIISNPQFKKVMIVKVIRAIYGQYKTWKRKRQDNCRDSFYDELMTTNRNSILIELNSLSPNDHGYLSNLKDKNRACFLSTLLGCLAIHHL